MNITVNVTLRSVEGALLRVLGTVERRGHRLLGVKSETSVLRTNAQDLKLEVNCGERSPDVLLRQLTRLHDVLTAHYRLMPASNPFSSPRLVTGMETETRSMANV
jgi:acetolactate synthase regulatory subunit